MTLRLNTLDRRLWQLAWPLMLTNITVPLLGLVDTAVLGHLEQPEHLGAVAIGANLFSILYWTFGFMRMGTTGLAAQSYGAGDAFGQSALLVRSLLLACTIGLILIVLQWPLIHTGLWFMDAGDRITALAQGYAAIRIWSAPAVLCQYTLVGWLIGTQFPRGPMRMLILANALNMLLDILFVTIWGWNSKGVAAATVIAEYAAAGLGLWLVWQRRPATVRFNRRLLGRLSDYRAILDVNRYIMIRTILLLLCIAFFTARGADFGATTLAANAVLITFLLLISNALDGFANAAEALVGEAIGQSRRTQFYAVCRTALRWSLWGALLCSVVFMVGGSLIISMLTSITEVAATARLYLPWIWLMPFAAVWGFLLDGIFIGATRTKDMQNAMVFAAGAIFLPVWWLSQGLGNNGLWLAMTSLMLGRAASMGWLFFRHSRHQAWFKHATGTKSAGY